MTILRRNSRLAKPCGSSFASGWRLRRGAARPESESCSSLTGAPGRAVPAITIVSPLSTLRTVAKPEGSAAGGAESKEGERGVMSLGSDVVFAPSSICPLCGRSTNTRADLEVVFHLHILR